MPYLLGLVLVSFILTSVFMVPFIDLLFFLKRKFQRQTINKNESQTPIHDVLMKADEKTPSGGGILLILILAVLSIVFYLLNFIIY